ncbi:DNA-directed DNA polymerase [Tanacetum coccineum]|uniref:DNA-directed DNA polymerase n=1 Tax=Tanacetum coccineum TaxID=301880 RepID=A0ABQ5B7B6_9ASTR
MDNLNITMEEYIRLEEEKAHRHDFENEFPAIIYNDALTSKPNFLTEPTLKPQPIDEFNLKDDTSLSEYDEVEQNVLYFNDLFLFNIIYPDNLKSGKDNDDNEIDIIQSSGGNMEGYTKEIVHDFEKRLEDLGGARLSMTWRQIILALGLHTADEMAEDIFEAYWLGRSLAITVGLAWVTQRAERHPVAAAAAPGGAEDALDINEGAQAILAPIHVHPPPPPAADYCSDIQYAVSIKEDTAYLCLHFTKDHEGNKINTPYPENPIRRIQVIECEDFRRYQTWLLLQEIPNTPLRKEKEEAQQKKFLENLKQLHINLPSIEALAQMPKCSVVLLNKLLLKEKDPGSFTIPCDIGHLHINNALADLGASISLMPYMMYEKLDLGEPKATKMSLELADRSNQYPRGIVENVLIKVDKFVLPIDFFILDMPKDSKVPRILGRPFLATVRAMIDVFNKKITLKVGDDEVIFDMDQSIKRSPAEDDECYGVDDLDDAINAEAQELLKMPEPNKVEREQLYSASANKIDEKKPELNFFPQHLEYACLHGDKSFPIIISSELSKKEKMLLLHVLEKGKGQLLGKCGTSKESVHHTARTRF